MSPQDFSTLKRYAMKYAKDVDDQDELVLQAYEEGVRLGEKRSMPLLINFMKMRGKESNRSIVGVKAGGKSLRDAFHQKPVSLDATLGHFPSSHYWDPFGLTVVAGFDDDLSEMESAVAEQNVSGFEACRSLSLNRNELLAVKSAVRQKALQHLS